MYLEKIELQGFKSFAKRTILEFQKSKPESHSVTVIVGPNGSGKSNIADAIKWVLGEQSIKSVRGKKAEDVIFSGSEKKSRLGFAEVSLYLNNEDRAGGIDYSEVVITRRLYRDGNSEYLLNKNPVRLFDIQLLIARAHFGQKSFSIISQGMIDSVLLATPLERKSFFDEAVGIKEHQIKRHQALNKLERSEEHLAQAQLLLQELGPQLRSLTRQVKRLEQRQQVQASLREYQQEYYHRQWTLLKKTADEQKAAIGKLQVELTTEEETMAGLRAQISALTQVESRGALFADLQKQLQAKQQDKNRLLREITVLKGRLEVDLEKQGKLNLAWLYRQEEEVTQRIADAQKELASLVAEHDTAAKDLREKKERLQVIRKTLKDLQKHIEQVRQQLQDEATKGPLNVLSRRVAELSEAFDDFLKRLLGASGEVLAKLSEEGASLLAQMQEMGAYIQTEIQGADKEKLIKVSESQELWRLQEELKALASEEESLLPDLTKREIQVNVLLEKRRLMDRDLAQLHNELKRVSSDLQTQQSAEKTGSVDTDAIKQQQAGFESEVAGLEQAIVAIEQKINAFHQEEEQKQNQIFALEREFQTHQQASNRLLQQKNTIQVELARSETKLEDLETEIRRELGEVTVVQARPENAGDVSTLPTDHIFSQIEKFKCQLELIGGIDPQTMDEYKQVKERHDFLDGQITDLTGAIDKLEVVIQELDKTIHEQFDRSFNKISREFERYFQILFGGGRAKLIKVMEEEKEAATSEGEAGEQSETAPVADVLEKEEVVSRAKKYKRSDYQGIDIFASPPGKKLSTISMLSGGERSLTSLALIAAIIHTNPSPFILMDEVDAALDEANSQRMARVLDDLRKITQFVIITHNRTVMSIADTIYGVTMGHDGVSQLLSVKLEEIDKHTTRL